jgi:hypothetical protein
MIVTLDIVPPRGGLACQPGTTRGVKRPYSAPIPVCFATSQPLHAREGHMQSTDMDASLPRSSLAARRPCKSFHPRVQTLVHWGGCALLCAACLGLRIISKGRQCIAPQHSSVKHFPTFSAQTYPYLPCAVTPTLNSMWWQCSREQA